MKIFKLISALLICVLVFSGCINRQAENDIKQYNFIAGQSNIFPFYVIGEDDDLWRVERHSAYSTKIRVNYPKGSSQLNFVRYLKEDDCVIFATEITVENGTVIADICQLTKNDFLKIKERVKLNSLHLKNNGDMLFIDETDTLFFRRDGILIKIEENVAQSEFVGEDTFLFRLDTFTETDGQKLYPIYYATAEYRNHLMDGKEIISSDSENGKAYIIKEKRTVQKRASSCEVATVYVYADGEILFELPSVVLSQFSENKHIFLLTINEESPTLTYDLYRTDSTGAVLMAKNIISGRYVSPFRDVYAYEFNDKGKVLTALIDYREAVLTYDLGNECSLEIIYCSNQNVYALKNNTLVLLENGTETKLHENVDAVKNVSGALLLFNGKTPPYTITVCLNREVHYEVHYVQNSNVYYKDGNLYYYSGEGLNILDKWGASTAIISNIDTDIGFFACEDTVAVSKKDDKTLHIAGRWGMVNATVKIKKFVQEV